MFEKEAEKWTIDYVCKDCSRYKECRSKEQCTCKECSKEKWQKGAEFGYNKAFVEADKNLKAIVTDFNKANEWHDLRKDPNDLPTRENLHNFSKCVLCALKFDDFVFYQVMSLHYPSKTWIVVDSDKNYSNKNVIAWCELTKFEE